MPSSPFCDACGSTTVRLYIRRNVGGYGQARYAWTPVGWWCEKCRAACYPDPRDPV